MSLHGAVEPDDKVTASQLQDASDDELGIACHSVNVVEISQEWAGAGNLETDSDASCMQVAARGKRQLHAPAFFSLGNNSDPADYVHGRDGPTETAQNAAFETPEIKTTIQASPFTRMTCPMLLGFYCRSSSGGAHFIFFAFVYIADFIMRTWTLVVCMRHGATDYVCLLAPLQIFGMILSGYITLHDADVQLWLHNISKEHWIVRIPAMSLMCGVFGCLQMIQVKRAWARQMHTAGIMTEMDPPVTPQRTPSEEVRASMPDASGHYGGRERVLPVALFTGVPYLIIVVCILQKELWAVWQGCSLMGGPSKLCFNVDFPDWVLMLSIIMAVGTVSLGIVEIDIAVSAHVLKRHHYQSEESSLPLCADHAQWLYACCHIFFRACEVTMRVILISTLFLVTHNIWGQILMIMSLLVDYIFGIVLLRRHSCGEEHLWVHILVGVVLLVVDLTHFIDEPTYAEPARAISLRLSVWRFLGLLCVLFISFCAGHADAPPTRFGWEFRNYMMLISASLYFLMRFSPLIRFVGQDLHTAAGSGNLERTSELLKTSSADQVFDVNVRTKDREEMTPAMLAALGGHKEILDCLCGAGADVNAQSASGGTCLHLAAARLDAETCRFLLYLGADPKICNNEGLRPKEVLRSRRWCSLGAQKETAHAFAEHSGCCDSPLRQRKIYTVSAEPCELPLVELFPEIAGRDDQMPAPHSLHSVSGLIASRSAGVLVRRVLAPVNPPMWLPLGALRRVRDLGVGGFGRVIEVEIPYRTWDNLWRGSRPRRFAMKIQPKHKSRQTAASEVLALQRVRHPFIVHLERAFATRKFFVLLLELCPTDLNRVLCEPRPDGRCLGLPADRAARYMGQILLALVHLHEVEGLLYRDVKPENILISEKEDAKLTDFGLAEKAAANDRKKTGTFGFLAPEIAEMATTQREGSCSEQSEGDKLRDTLKIDAYSFGVTLQLALLGENAGQIKDIHRKGRVMLPLFMSDQDNFALLRHLCEASLLCSDACDLLVDRLLSFLPSKRACLSDFQVTNHSFFLRSLGCDNLKSHLLSKGQLNRVASRSSFWDVRPRSRSSSNEDTRRLPLLEDFAQSCPLP